MKSAIKHWLERLTWRFIRLFLSYRPHAAPPFRRSSQPNPQSLLSDRYKTAPVYLTSGKFFPISFPAIRPTFSGLPTSSSSRALPMRHANRPILHANQPMLHANRLILHSNHPMFLGWGRISRQAGRSRNDHPQSFLPCGAFLPFRARLTTAAHPLRLFTIHFALFTYFTLLHFFLDKSEGSYAIKKLVSWKFGEKAVDSKIWSQRRGCGGMGK